MTWKDITSYSQSDPKREPRTYELRAAGERICVTKMVGCGDSWFLRAHGLGFDSRELGECSLQEAQQKAIALVTARLKEVLAALAGRLEGEAK